MPPDFISNLAADDILAGLHTLFPELVGHTRLKQIGIGFSSLVVELGDGMVFRIARNSDVSAKHAREAALLPRIQSHIPVAISDPQWFAGPSEWFPYGIIGYRKIEGIPFSLDLVAKVDAARLANDLADFLLALHAFPVARASESGVIFQDDDAYLESLRDDILPALRNILAPAEYDLIAQWWDDYLLDEHRREFSPRLVHGDFWGENLILDKSLRGVVGSVDFEAVHMGDIAQDFITQRYAGEDFANMIIRAYQNRGGDLGSGFDQRMAGLWGLREFGGLQYAIKFNDEEEFADSIIKLRKGPILGTGRW